VIASLDGIVSAVFADSMIVEVGGIGYRVFAAPSVLTAAGVGQRIKVFTHHVIREDLQALYGFRNPEELGFFGLLLTVTGVGPKVALGIVGSRAIGDLQLAILSDDLALLTAVPGVGKKLAARVVLELKEKVAAAGVAAGSAAGARGAAGESEVVAALLALGYSAGEARQASRDALTDLSVGPGLENRVKAALRTLLRG
jgi:Holliday junction DNA helicase RuvA